MRLAGDFCYNSHRFDSSREGLVLERVTLCLAARVTHPCCFDLPVAFFSVAPRTTFPHRPVDPASMRSLRDLRHFVRLLR